MATFCGREILPTFSCVCHRPAVTFTYAELQYVYGVIRGLLGPDIAASLASLFQQITISPTHAFVCYIHESSWMQTLPRNYESSCCPGYNKLYYIECEVVYIGCINEKRNINNPNTPSDVCAIAIWSQSGYVFFCTVYNSIQQYTTIYNG